MNMNEFPRFLSGVESSLPRMVASPSEENWVRFHMDLQSAQFIVPLDNKVRIRGVIPYITLRYVIALYPEIGGLVIDPFGMQMVLQREQVLMMSSVTVYVHTDRDRLH